MPCAVMGQFLKGPGRENREAAAKTGFEKIFSSGYSHISPDMLQSVIRVRPGNEFTGPTRFPFAGTRQDTGG